jgi:hypothetical protein
MPKPLDAALSYANAGWRIFPLGGAKDRPLVRWRDEATTSSETIRGFWDRWPNAWIALPTGERVAVLDVDLRDGKLGNGFDSLAKLVERWPWTPTAQTRSGGRHLYFAAPETPIRNTAGERGRGLAVG